jgi:hypothetical protein
MKMYGKGCYLMEQGVINCQFSILNCDGIAV